MEYYRKIEEVLRKNTEQRGMDGVILEDQLEMAAEALWQSTCVLILTGFVIRDTMSGETDGPLGAVSLAGALEQLGKKVILVTDQHSGDILQKALLGKGLIIPVEIVPQVEAEDYCRRLLARYRPSHVVAIERPGRSEQGRCYSMRGDDLTDLVPNTDFLFTLAREMGLITIAVGDGGNELGMGKIIPYIKKWIPWGIIIGASVSADYLIIAGVSNWGGHALAAALSVLAGKMLLHDPAVEAEILQNMVAAGSVDGCTKRPTLTVDGLSLEYNLEVLNLLRAITADALERENNKKQAV